MYLITIKSQCFQQFGSFEFNQVQILNCISQIKHCRLQKLRKRANEVVPLFLTCFSVGLLILLHFIHFFAPVLEAMLDPLTWATHLYCLIWGACKFLFWGACKNYRSIIYNSHFNRFKEHEQASNFNLNFGGTLFQILFPSSC